MKKLLFSALFLGSPAFAIQSVSLAPGESVLVQPYEPTQVICQGFSSSAQICTLQPNASYSNYTNIKMGPTVMPTNFGSMDDAAAEIKRLRDDGLCQ